MVFNGNDDKTAIHRMVEKKLKPAIIIHVKNQDFVGIISLKFAVISFTSHNYFERFTACHVPKIDYI